MVFSAIVEGVQTFLQFIWNVINNAPKPIRILLFLVLAVTTLTLVSNWIIASDLVCSEDTVYRADNLVWAISAKATAPLLEIDTAVPEDVVARTVENDDQADPNNEQPIGPILEQPSLIQEFTDVEFSQVSFSSFGTFMTTAENTIPKTTETYDGTALTGQEIVIALPLDHEGTDIRDFEWLASQMIGELVDYIRGKETAAFQVCMIPEGGQDFLYPDSVAGQCTYETARLGFIQLFPIRSCPIGTETIATVYYRMIPINNPEDRNTAEADPSQVVVDGTEEAIFSFNIEIQPTRSALSVISFGFLGSERSLDECSQTPLSADDHFLAPGAEQAEFGIIDPNDDIVGVAEQGGYVELQYAPITKFGVDAIVDDDGAQLRSQFIRKNPGKFDPLHQQDDDAALTYTCDDNQNVQVLWYGIPVFDPWFIGVFLFFIGMLTFLIKYIL
jgi:hypothetical protein